MACPHSEYDYQLYLQKAAQEPDPKPNSQVWADDPFNHDEQWHLNRIRAENARARHKAAEKSRKKQRKKQKVKR